MLEAGTGLAARYRPNRVFWKVVSYAVFALVGSDEVLSRR